MKATLERLFDHLGWAYRRALEALSRPGPVPATTLDEAQLASPKTYRNSAGKEFANVSLFAQTGDVSRRRPLCFGEPSTQPWTLPVSSRVGKTHTLVCG